MSNSNEIFMPENKSNKASIIVAVVAICLILGGVYLLNQSFSSSSKKDTPTQTASTTPSPSEASKTTATPTTVDSTTKPTTDTTPPETTNTVTTTPTTTPAPATPTTPAPTTSTTPALENNQLIAKVLSIDSSGMTKFEIQSCGIPNPVLCKSGTKFNLSGVKASVDKVYLVSGSITDGSSLSLENITIKEYIAT